MILFLIIVHRPNPLQIYKQQTNNNYNKNKDIYKIVLENKPRHTINKEEKDLIRPFVAKRKRTLSIYRKQENGCK